LDELAAFRRKHLKVEKPLDAGDYGLLVIGEGKRTLSRDGRII